MAMERWRGPRHEVTTWSPFREMEEMEREMDEIFRRPFFSLWRRMPAVEREWAPAIDLFEKGDNFVVKAELPGMKLEDIDVSVTDNTLTIKGEKKFESETKEEDYYRSERCYGKFFRSITFPSEVDAEHVEASYENGVLEVTVPKAAEVKPKKVPISAKKKES